MVKGLVQEEMPENLPAEKLFHTKHQPFLFDHKSRTFHGVFLYIYSVVQKLDFAMEHNNNQILNLSVLFLCMRANIVCFHILNILLVPYP